MLYRSDLDDDIAFISSAIQGRAFFANIGNTRRQGLDAELRLTTDRWLAYIDYSFIDATFQSTFVEASGNNPAADLNGNITVQPGSRLPGIPTHQLKVGPTTRRPTSGPSAPISWPRVASTWSATRPI